MQSQPQKKSYGFTLVELLVTIGLIGSLIGLTTISLINVQRKVTLSSTITTLISDLKEQQTKAMTGDTGGVSKDSYGIYLDTNRYILFHGDLFSSTDPSNFAINLANIEFSNPGTSIVFSQVSGEIAAASNITLTDITNNQQKTIQINKYGVVTAIN